jgi:hypothetical protein
MRSTQRYTYSYFSNYVLMNETMHQTGWIDDNEPWFDAAAYEKTILTRNDALPLIIAAQTNDLPTVRQFIAEGTDINAHGVLGETALHMAVALGYTDIVSFLLEAGADPNAKGPNGRDSSPLIYAVRFCPAEAVPQIIRALLQAGADPAYTVRRDLWQLNALHWAVHSGNLAAIPPLVSVCPHERAIKEATGNLRTEAVSRRHSTRSPFMRHGFEALQLLLEHGVVPTKSDLWDALFAGSWPAFDLIRRKLALRSEEFNAFAANALVEMVSQRTASQELTLEIVARRFFEECGVDVNLERIPVAVIASGNGALLELATARGLNLKSLSDEKVGLLVDEAISYAKWRGTPKDWRERIAACRQ